MSKLQADNDVTMGGNAVADLKRRIDRRVEIAEELAEIKSRLDEYKKEDKDDGYNEKAIARTVKMIVADPEKRLATLLLDAEFRTYCEAAGLAMDLEAAEREVRKHVEDVPEPKSKGKKRRGRDELN